MDEETEFPHAADENEESGDNEEGHLHGDEEDEDEGEGEDDEVVEHDLFSVEDLSSPLIAAAKAGDLTSVRSLLAQGDGMNEADNLGRTALWYAADQGHNEIVQLLVEQGADKEKSDTSKRSPLFMACCFGRLEVARYLLEQGANREKATVIGWTPLHVAADNGHLVTAKLLMVYGADLNARDNDGDLPIDLARNEDIRQAIRDEPRRRMDHGHKRATEQDRHPNAAASASALQEEVVEEGQSNKRPRLNEEGVVTIAEDENKVAEEDEDSEPSDNEDGN